MAGRRCRVGLDLLELNGLRALVTGAGVGLGRQLASALAEAGADLAIGGRRREPSGSGAAVWRALGRDVTILRAAATGDAGRRRWLADAGRVDGLASNTGGGALKLWRGVSRAGWRRIMDVDLYSPFGL